MDKKKKTNIRFRISFIKRISHFEHSLDELKLKERDVKNGNIELNIFINVDEKNDEITFKIDTTFFVNKNKKRIDLFGVEIIHGFEVKNMGALFPRDKKRKLEIPDNFMITLLNAVIGCLRGILLLSRTNPEYQEIYLPALNMRKILPSITKSES